MNLDAVRYSPLPEGVPATKERLAETVLHNLLNEGDYKGTTIEGWLVIELQLDPSEFDHIMAVVASDDEDDDFGEDDYDNEIEVWGQSRKEEFSDVRVLEARVSN